MTRTYSQIEDIFLIWKGIKAGLLTFIKEQNEEQKTINFDFQILPRKIVFFDPMLRKFKNSNIQTTLCYKCSDEQAFLQTKSEHWRSVNNRAPYIQAFKLKIIYSTPAQYKKNCAVIKQEFLVRRYKERVLDQQIKKVDRIKTKRTIQK